WRCIFLSKRVFKIRRSCSCCSDDKDVLAFAIIYKFKNKEIKKWEMQNSKNPNIQQSNNPTIKLIPLKLNSREDSYHSRIKFYKFTYSQIHPFTSLHFTIFAIKIS